MLMIVNDYDLQGEVQVGSCQFLWIIESASDPSQTKTFQSWRRDQIVQMWWQIEGRVLLDVSDAGLTMDATGSPQYLTVKVTG